MIRSRRVLPVAALLLSLAALPDPVRAQVDPETPLPVDPSVRMGELENGLRYYVRANDRPEDRAELRLVVDAGSILEDESQRGLAHLLEHMAFNGTESFERQELVDYLESIGMAFGPSVNASTSFDETIYMLRVPTDDPETLATGFQILEEWAHRITLDPEEVDQERGVVIEEWRLGRGAAARIADQQIPVIFEGSRYAERLPIGDVEVLETFPHEEIVRFYEEWYRPDLMAVVAVGDFDPAEVEATIRERFAAVPAHPDAPERPTWSVPDQEGTRVSIATDPEATGSQVVIVRLQDPPETGTVGDFRRGLVESLATTLLNQRMAEVAQQADPPFLGAGGGRANFIRTKSAWQLGAAVSEEGHLRGLEAALTEAERAARFGFTPSELQRARADVARSFERSLAERETQPSARFVNEYVAHFLRDQPIPSIEAEAELGLELLPGITLEEVNEVARRNLEAESRAILVTGIEKPGIEMPTEEELVEVFQTVEAAELEPWQEEELATELVAELPAPGSIVSQERIDSVGLTVWELSNGATVWVKPTDFKEDEVLFRATSPGGWSTSSEEAHPSASFGAAAVQISGVGDFSMLDLRKALAGKAVSVSPTIDETHEGLVGSASPRDLETLMELVWLHFTAPRRDAETFQAVMAQSRAALANRSADPGAAFGDTLTVTLTQHHPRFQPPTVEELERIDLDRAVDFYEERFASAHDFTFVFVGAVDPAELRPLAERYLAALPGEPRDDAWVDLGIDPPAERVEKVVRKGIEPQSRTAMVFTGPFDYTFQNRFDIRVLAGILEIRLRERLREDLGGTYSVGVGASYEQIPDEEYSLRVQFGSDPERAEELRAAVFEEIGRLKTDGPSEEDVQKVLEQQRRSKETALEQNGWWATQLLLTAENRGDPRKLLDESRAAGVTVETVREDARRWLDEERVVIVVLKPEEGGVEEGSAPARGY